MDTLRQISPLSKGWKDKNKMKKSEDAQNEGGASMSQENETIVEAIVEETVAVTDEAAETVEVFEDEVAEAEAPAEETEDAPKEEIEKSDQVDAVSDEVPAEEAPAEEAPAEEEASEDQAESEAAADDDLAKSLAAVKDFIADTVAKSEEANLSRLSEVVNVVSDLAKTLNEKLAEVKVQQEDFSKALAEVKGHVDTMNNRVEAVEDTTAVKKSGELGDSSEVEEPIRKSVWGGRFLATADMLG
jgi:chromosome segregation ATPase